MKDIKISKKELKFYNKKESKETIENKTLEAITRKALNVIYACSKNTNKYVIEMIENKHIETLEELKQEVYLKALESGYILNNKLCIKKQCFKTLSNKKELILLNKKAVFSVVNSIIYKRKKEELHSITIYESETMLNNNSYVEYITRKEENTYKKNGFKLEKLNLTSRQIEILNIYSKTGSINKVAELLGISKQAVSKTINGIRNKVLAVA